MVADGAAGPGASNADDVDLTAAEVAERTENGGPPPDPWSRPGVRPVESIASPLSEPVRELEGDESELLPHRGRHHRRRRARRGPGDVAPPETGVSGSPVAAPTGFDDMAPRPPNRWLAPDRYDAPVPDPTVAPASPPEDEPPVTPEQPEDAIADAPDGITTPSGLPRRTPHPSGGREPGLAAAPPPRPPDAVFELVARYEAGRRRAGTRPTDTHRRTAVSDAAGPRRNPSTTSASCSRISSTTSPGSARPPSSRRTACSSRSRATSTGRAATASPRWRPGS